MMQEELTDDTIWPKSWAGGKINQPGQLAPHPSDKGKPLEQLILVTLEHIFITSEKHVNITVYCK